MANTKARGRPKLPADLKRDRSFQIWISQREEQLLKEQAALDKVSVRDLLLAGPLFRERCEREDLVPASEVLKLAYQAIEGLEKTVALKEENAELAAGIAAAKLKNAEEDEERLLARIAELKEQNARLRKQGGTLAGANVRLQRELKEGKATWRKESKTRPRAPRVH